MARLDADVASIVAACSEQYLNVDEDDDSSLPFSSICL
jgi:hypothetical protein